MGYRSDGVQEPIYELSSPLHVITIIFYLSVMLSTFVTAYFVIIARKIGNKKFEWMMIVLLLVCISHQLVLLCFLFIESPPFLDWINTSLGVYLLMGSGIINCEILYFFSSLTEFWNLRKIRWFELFWVLYHFFCYAEGYTQLGFIGRKIPSSIPRAVFLYGHGVTLYCVSLSIVYAIKSLYIVRLIYRHLSIKQQENIEKRVPQMRRLASTIIIGTIFNWIGIVLFGIRTFTSESRSFFLLGASCLYLHVNNIAVIFYQLKYSTLTTDEEGDPPKKTIKWLVAQSQDEAIQVQSLATVFHAKTLATKVAMPHS
jgi:hypothetical protein